MSINEQRRLAARILDDSLYTWGDASDFSSDALELAKLVQAEASLTADLLAALEAQEAAEAFTPLNSTDLMEWRRLNAHAKALRIIAIAKARGTDGEPKPRGVVGS